MAQATKRVASTKPHSNEQLTELVRALYDVAGHARRFQSSDPVDTAGVRLLYVLNGLGDARPSDLAALTGLDLSTVSRHVRTLESRGLIARAEDPSDRRAQRVGVTAAGVDAMHDVLANRVAALAGVLDAWPAADRLALGTMLRRLADDLEAQHCPSPKDRSRD